MSAGANVYYPGMSWAQLIAALAQDVGAIFKGPLTLGSPVTIPAPAAADQTTLSITGPSYSAVNKYAATIQANATAGHSFGLQISAGTNASDIALEIENASGSANYLVVWGDGHIELGPSVGAGNAGLVCSSTGSFVIYAPTGAAAALAVFGPAGHDALEAIGSSSSGNSYGFSIEAGTTAGDYAMRVYNQAVSTLMFSIGGTGVINIAPTVANGGALIQGYNSTGATRTGYLDFISGTGGGGAATEVALELDGSTVNDWLTLITGGTRSVRVDGTGAFYLLRVATTTTAPGAGGAGALPATPAGYMTIGVGTTARKVAYY